MRYLTFEEFKVSDHRNLHVREFGIEVYVRRTIPPFITRYGEYQLATFVAENPGSGSLTKFLEKYEPGNFFYIENVFETRFQKFWESRGYIAVNRNLAADSGNIPCYLGPDNRPK